jgi:hypothetical protein
MFLVVNEPEEQEFSLKNQISAHSGVWLTLAWNIFQFLDFFDWPTIKTNEKIQKLSSKHVSGGELRRRAEIFLAKSKFQQILGNMFGAFRVFR